MRLQNLLNELISLDLQYHEIVGIRDETIKINAISMDLKGIDEIAIIKKTAEKFDLCTNWDGKNITITR